MNALVFASCLFCLITVVFNVDQPKRTTEFLLYEFTEDDEMFTIRNGPSGPYYPSTIYSTNIDDVVTEPTEEDDFDELIEHREGDTNIFMILPHSGRLAPTFMEPRAPLGCFNYETLSCDYKNVGCETHEECLVQLDAYPDLKPLVDIIYNEFIKRLGVKPHYLMNKVHTRYVDVAAGIDQATYNSLPNAEFYAHYINKVGEILDEMESYFKRNLLIEFTFHNVDNESICIGHGIDGSQLYELANDFKGRTSVEQLGKDLKVSEYDLVFGNQSLVHHLHERGLSPVLPTATNFDKVLCIRDTKLTKVHRFAIGSFSAISIAFPYNRKLNVEELEKMTDAIIAFANGVDAITEIRLKEVKSLLEKPF